MFFRDVLSGEHGEYFFDNSVFFKGIVREAARPRPPRPAAPARRLIRFRKLSGRAMQFLFFGLVRGATRPRQQPRPPAAGYDSANCTEKKKQNESERRDERPRP